MTKEDLGHLERGVRIMNNKLASMPKNIPTGPGFYWARKRDYNWWNLIAWVSGKAPFLRCKIIDLAHDQIVENVDVSYDIWFGIKIEKPKDPIDGDADD